MRCPQHSGPSRCRAAVRNLASPPAIARVKPASSSASPLSKSDTAYWRCGSARACISALRDTGAPPCLSRPKPPAPLPARTRPAPQHRAALQTPSLAHPRTELDSIYIGCQSPSPHFRPTCLPSRCPPARYISESQPLSAIPPPRVLARPAPPQACPTLQAVVPLQRSPLPARRSVPPPPAPAGRRTGPDPPATKLGVRLLTTHLRSGQLVNCGRTEAGPIAPDTKSSPVLDAIGQLSAISSGTLPSTKHRDHQHPLCMWMRSLRPPADSDIGIILRSRRQCPRLDAST